MIWQDLVLTVGGFVFVAGLVPMLRAQTRPPLSTSIPLAGTMAMYAVAMATLDLWLSAGPMVVQSFIWATLAVQRMRL